MVAQVAKIKKFQKKAGKGALRWVRLDDDDQDDRNELALFLLGPSDLKGNNFPQVFLMMDTPESFWLAIVLPTRKVPSFSGFLNYMESDSKNSVRK
ncbi:unnamed protein product [Brassica rapa subsp. narinosa]|uniref:(rape) hypothetical protein n=1 Tax=Brassica napus TaxID=3708 RepID=A0A816X8P4_BRANA|nr:unnamed protein product [Brassica napus]